MTLRTFWSFVALFVLILAVDVVLLLSLPVVVAR